MKVFVINLDRDRDRMAAVDRQLNDLGIKYERIPAVNGKSLSKVEKNSAVNYFRWWCAVGRPITDGEIGCALSHAKIYQRIIDDNIPLACILEDDVVLDKRFGMVLEYLERNYPKESNYACLLSNHSDGSSKLGEEDSGYLSPETLIQPFMRSCGSDMFMEAYVLGVQAAKALLRANSPILTPCDWWGRWNRLGVVKLHHVFPTVACQNRTGYASNTQGGMMTSVSQMPFWRYCCHKFKRLIGKQLDCFFIKVIGR